MFTILNLYFVYNSYNAHGIFKNELFYKLQKYSEKVFSKKFTNTPTNMYVLGIFFGWFSVSFLIDFCLAKTIPILYSGAKHFLPKINDFIKNIFYFLTKGNIDFTKTSATIILVGIALLLGYVVYTVFYTNVLFKANEIKNEILKDVTGLTVYENKQYGDFITSMSEFKKEDALISQFIHMEKDTFKKVINELPAFTNFWENVALYDSGNEDNSLLTEDIVKLTELYLSIDISKHLLQKNYLMSLSLPLDSELSNAVNHFSEVKDTLNKLMDNKNKTLKSLQDGSLFTNNASSLIDEYKMLLTKASDLIIEGGN